MTILRATVKRMAEIVLSQGSKKRYTRLVEDDSGRISTSRSFTTEGKFNEEGKDRNTEKEGGDEQT